MRLCYKMRVMSILVFCLLAFSKIIFAQEISTSQNEIYSKLGDLNCRTIPLNKCFCPAAREMKAYIDALIEAGVSQEEIFYKVAKKFSINTILDEKVKADIEKRLAQEFGRKRPKISLEFTSFDFGKVSRKHGTLRKKIKLYNEGIEDLIITKIKAACSCTTVALTVGKNKSPYFGNKGSDPGWQMVVGPNKSAEVEFVLDLTSFAKVNIPSKLKRDIFIASNDPIYPDVHISGMAEIVE